MTRLATEPPRPYRSQLRADQTEDTRTRILNATVRVMAAGMASVSVPAVAREAGVSVPTVYRHFGTKRELFAAVFPHLVRRAGLREIGLPTSMDDLRTGLIRLFDRIDSLDDVGRAVLASPGAEEARRSTMPDRFAMTRRFAESIEPRLPAQDRDRIARLLVVLTTSSALRVWRDHLGSSVEEAADDIDRTIRAAVAAATRGER